MPFEIVRNDITTMKVDAIVNTTNREMIGYSGVDLAVHTVAGPELDKECAQIAPLELGTAKVTRGYNLPCKYVIHTSGPTWDGGCYREELLLRNCYDSSLKLAVEYDCKSIAFPLISSGNYGFPKDKALQIAISAFSEFLLTHEMQVYLVVFDDASFRLSEKLFHHVAIYIDQHYVDTFDFADYSAAYEIRTTRRRRDKAPRAPRSAAVEALPCNTIAEPKAVSLEEMLRQADAGFTETLMKLIDQSGKKDSQVYKRASISKQHFSKIRSNPNYKPTKATALALAIALELNLEETKDLIGRAGYALTNSSKFDLIIRYFIEQRNYNIVEINIALYEFDQNLLGA